ncbi:hypothetical protein RGUI_2382 [Rhodovulum sp. P5]|uniref:hypothetical protein n=1 Tax=Rhodovulum sp. P5 TaxID=1564506 RepID=UPI0009C1F041|nr:hypothetical protein [Rhodovulum sp. P5]ARE40523.1 hypothetical protein RGUI_2382 [Rhodovulum sp. P5]
MIRLKRRRKVAFPPVPRFSEPDLKRLKDAYADAASILEYGSGGSTIIAAELGKKVRSVESDKGWTALLNAHLDSAFPDADARVIHSDIGRTGKWGKPVNRKAMENFYRYPLAIWDAPDFTHPDVILIDGRFRVACFCTAVMRIERPTLVLFDDFVVREKYHTVEALAKPVERLERMAVFELEPGMVPRSELTWVIGSFFRTSYA